MKTKRFKISRGFISHLLIIVVSVLFYYRAYAPNALPATLVGTPMTLLTFSNLTVSQSYQMQRTFAWYWTNLPVSFTAAAAVYTQMVTGAVQSVNYRLALNPVPAQAFATAQVVGGSVVGATITAGGSGYVTAPTVLIVRGGGINAAAVTSISSGGMVTNINITSSGTGYTNTPIIQIAPPPAVAISPSSQPVVRLSFPSDHTGWRLQRSSSIIAANWQDIPGSSQSNQFDFFVTNDIYFFRMVYP